MTVTVVVGGQFGSEGKGNVAGELHRRHRYHVGVRVGGPNAGHTVYDDGGRKFALRQIPVAAAVDPNCELFIAEGSEIDPAVLHREIVELEAAGHRVVDRLWVHPEATMISEAHKMVEESAEHGAHGSTNKGIGAARADRLMRKAKRAVEGLSGVQFTRPHQNRWATGDVLVEGTQGYGLGSHAGYYPHCTSGDCRAIDFMAQAGMNPFTSPDVWVVLRTYPIRIAGPSGPLEGETTWGEVGVSPEYTTVTQRIRRVGYWDQELAREAVRANGGHRTKLALTFADYWWPELHNRYTLQGADCEGSVHERVAALQTQLGASIHLIGTGPCSFIRYR